MATRARSPALGSTDGGVSTQNKPWPLLLGQFVIILLTLLRKSNREGSWEVEMEK